MTTLSVVNMEEREALKREIEVLQDLIDNHKRIHGDNPFASVPLPEAQRPSRGFGTLVGHSYCSRGRIYPSEDRGSWKRKYSLRNKNPQSSSAHPSIATSSSSSSELTASTSLTRDHRGEESVKTPTLSPRSSLQSTKNVTPVTKGTINTANMMQHKIHHSKIYRSQQMPESRREVPAENNTSPAVVKKTTSLRLPSLVGITDTKRPDTVAVSADLTNATITSPTAAVAKLSKQPSSNASTHRNQHQSSKPSSTNSKFVWVKTQNVEGAELQKSSRVPTPAGKTVNDFPSSTSGVESTVVYKKTAAKKPPQRISQDSLSTKTSKYKWVSSTASQAKVSRKSLSPKVLPLTQKALETGGIPKRVKAALTSPTIIKKEVATSSRSSRYSWKAATAGGVAVLRRSSFYWTADKRNKGARGGFSPGTLRTSLPSPSSSPGAFKLRSRMKIIRSGSEKVISTSGVKFSTPGRSSAAIRGPAGVRRTSSRELVSFGRHKLRRLCTSFARTSPSSSSSSPHQEFGSPRYRARLGPGAAHTHHYNPAVSWRAKKIQSARSFLQSRLRAHRYRHPPSSRQWTGSSMCWIRGSLYQVSANKLSRTVASSPATGRAGKNFGSAQSSVMAWNRASSTRHLASRAVQRSLAIIRHARQKKQLKQYCMYYNRFGKCNRGNTCPYIHDPDKVAVCTRFLRGMCKKAEGICPFSHKVAKEKMPVCSYFLKGICNNNDCPYSHVYVSHKAEVCEDFVKGYCPEGEKCKKKHTLVCPDFSKRGSCPQGARCKLQHRQRAKRSCASTAATLPAKRARSREPASSRQEPQAAPGTPAGGPLELPSYISLCSSPEEADTQLEDTARGKEKKLQIKPRLRDARERLEEELGAAGLS